MFLDLVLRQDCLVISIFFAAMRASRVVHFHACTYLCYEPDCSWLAQLFEAVKRAVEARGRTAIFDFESNRNSVNNKPLRKRRNLELICRSHFWSGLSRGVEVVAHSLHDYLSEHKGSKLGLLKIDFDNAVNEIKRSHFAE